MNTLFEQDAATPPEDSNTRLISLTKGQFAIVDAEDYPTLSQYRWFAICPKNIWYATRNKSKKDKSKPRVLYMHRDIMGNPPGMYIDHRDGNGLNNTKQNLRVATSSQNHFNRGPQKDNTSGFKGVSWNKKDKRWAAYIKVNRRTKYLGNFTDRESAAAAYAAAAEVVHGEFARVVPFE